MTQEEISKLPTILDILNEISGREEGLRNNPRYGFLFSQEDMDDKFEVTQIEENGPNMLVPAKSFFSTHYRGQNRYYETCFPTLYRNLELRDDIDRFIERIRTCDFELLIHTHPFVKHVFKNGMTLYLDKIGEVDLSLLVNSEALAQHYELQTDLIDVTFNKWVAAFFAVSEMVKGRYIPMDSKGYGVFYFYWPQYNFYFSSNKENNFVGNSNFSTINFQPFPRPAAQNAGTVKLEKGVDFNSFPGVQKYFFRHDRLASQIIFNRMNQGKDLFPDDDLEEISRKVKASKKLSIQAFNLAFDRYPVVGITKEELRQLCIDKGVKLINYEIFKFDKSLNKKFQKYWNQKGEEDFLSKIVYRYSYIGPIKEVDAKELASQEHQ